VDVTYKGERAPRVSFPTKAEAEAVAADFRAALIRGETITPSVSARRGRIDDQQNNLCNLGALFDHTFRLYWQGTKGERTARINGQAWVETLGERCDVRTLTSADISRVCDEWSDRGSAPGTINRKMAALGKMLGVAEADQIIPRKPLLPKRKEYAGRLRYYSREEEEHMLAYFRTTGETELAYLVTLAMDTGLRAGELRELQVRDYVPLTRPAARLGVQVRRTPVGAPHVQSEACVGYTGAGQGGLGRGLSGPPDALPCVPYVPQVAHGVWHRGRYGRGVPCLPPHLLLAPDTGRYPPRDCPEVDGAQDHRDDHAIRPPRA